MFPPIPTFVPAIFIVINFAPSPPFSEGRGSSFGSSPVAYDSAVYQTTPTDISFAREFRAN